MFKQLDEAIFWIESQIRFRPKVSLENMNNAYLLLNKDVSKIKKVHITGTNGKGSTTVFTSNILINSGYKVGTFISPYLLKFNERIQIDLIPISDNDLLNYINEVYELNSNFTKQYSEGLSFFELITLIAISYFYDKEVDILVMEVGIGGLFDATNILTYDISAITNIGLEHTKQLGETIEEIAVNKLGILSDDKILITTVDDELKELFINYADNKNSVIKFIDKTKIKIISEEPLRFEYKRMKYTLKNMIGHYQVLNAILASEISRNFAKVTEESIKKGLENTFFAGRFEKISNNPIIYLDGAHNSHAIDSLKDSIEKIFKKKVYFLYSSLSDKDASLMVKKLVDISKKIVLTKFPDPRIGNMAELASNINDSKVIFESDSKKALDLILNEMKSDDILVITGSIHFIGYIKNCYFNIKNQ